MGYRKPYRVRKKKSIFKNRFFWLLLLLFFSSASILYLLIFSKFFQIKEIRISGNEKIKREELEKFIWEKVDQKIVFFPTKSIFLAKPQEIEKNLSGRFFHVASNQIRQEFPSVLVVEITERKPVFVICKDLSPCFQIDQEGIPFEEISGEEIPFLKVRHLEPQEIKLGQAAVEKELVDGIASIGVKLKETTGVSPTGIILASEKIEVQTDQNFQIYFSSKESIPAQFENLILVFQEEIPQEKRGNLEYIDLRFGNRVYYKFRE